jgi:hypothetical protein
LAPRKWWVWEVHPLTRGHPSASWIPARTGVLRTPLDQIVDAYRYVETRRKIGNVLISVDPDI